MFDEIFGIGVLDDGGDTEDFGGGEGGGAEGVVDGAATIRVLFFPLLQSETLLSTAEELSKEFRFQLLSLILFQTAIKPL